MCPGLLECPKVLILWWLPLTRCEGLSSPVWMAHLWHPLHRSQAPCLVESFCFFAEDPASRITISTASVSANKCSCCLERDEFSGQVLGQQEAGICLSRQTRQGQMLDLALDFQDRCMPTSAAVRV
jgi:hypothetical protein